MKDLSNGVSIYLQGKNIYLCDDVSIYREVYLFVGRCIYLYVLIIYLFIGMSVYLKEYVSVYRECDIS